MIKAKTKKELNDFNEYKISDLSPNFEYEEDIVDDYEGSYALIDTFEAFISIKDEKPYIVYQNKISQNLEVLKVLKNKYKLVYTIKGHNSQITTIKYFLNEDKNIEYIISIDYNGKIIITNITENYKKESDFKSEYDNGQITCGLMIFRINEKIDFDIKNGLIIISNKNSFQNQYTPTKVYALNPNGNYDFIFDITTTSLNSTSSMIHWFNLIDKKDYIIDFGDKKVDVITLLKSEIYATFRTNLETSYHNGIVYNDEEQKTELLYFTSIKSSVFVFDLYHKQFIKEIKTSSNLERLYGIIQWNKNYFNFRGNYS